MRTHATMPAKNFQMRSYPRDWKRFCDTLYDVSSLCTLDMVNANAIIENPCKWANEIFEDHADKRIAFQVPRHMRGEKIADIVCALAKTELSRCDIYIINGNVINANSPKWIRILREMAKTLFDRWQYEIVVGMFDRDSIHRDLRPADIIQQSIDRLRAIRCGVPLMLDV